MSERETTPTVQRASLTEAQEDYLKQMLLIGGDGGRVSTQALAERLRVRPASVTEMVGRLVHLGLVEHAPYRGVWLTGAGRSVALEMLRHHRLLETYLVDVLGYTWDQVHEEAERLEHVISERFEERIAEVLGHPTHDPHGDPIPNLDLSMPKAVAEVPLSDLPIGLRSRVVRVDAQDAESLATIGRMGLVPGSTVEIVEEQKSTIRVRVEDQVFVLSPALARQLWTEGEER